MSLKVYDEEVLQTSLQYDKYFLKHLSLIFFFWLDCVTTAIINKLQLIF